LKFELTRGILGPLGEFRYAHDCPLARATEVVGERWTLLVIRELLLGPKRFSDLKRALAGVSTSVLSHRLARLEDRGVISRRQLPPPTPATLYALSEIGRGLVPVILELVRWGARFLDHSHPGDHVEPAWLRLGCAAFARKTPTPARVFVITVEGHGEVAFHVAGGEEGTAVRDGLAPADATLRVASPLVLFALAARRLAPERAVRTGALRVEGDLAALDDFPQLFDMAPDGSEPPNPRAPVILPPDSNWGDR
jgi:DNA-binding HxlR family transcriptional regulator